MAYYECGGYSKADLDEAYNNGYIAGGPNTCSQLSTTVKNSYTVVPGAIYFEYCPSGGHVCTGGGSTIATSNNTAYVLRATTSTMTFNANVFLWRIK